MNLCKQNSLDQLTPGILLFGDFFLSLCIPQFPWVFILQTLHSHSVQIHDYIYHSLIVTASSQPMTAFFARNGGPTKSEDCSFKPIHVKGERNGPPSANQGLSTATYIPPPPPLFLLTQNPSLKDGLGTRLGHYQQ